MEPMLVKGIPTTAGQANGTQVSNFGACCEVHKDVDGRCIDVAVSRRWGASTGEWGVD